MSFDTTYKSIIAIEKERSEILEKIESIKQLYLNSFVLRGDSLEPVSRLEDLKKVTDILYDNRLKAIQKVGNT